MFLLEWYSKSFLPVLLNYKMVKLSFLLNFLKGI